MNLRFRHTVELVSEVPRFLLSYDLPALRLRVYRRAERIKSKSEGREPQESIEWFNKNQALLQSYTVIRLTEYTECQAFCLVVGIGSPHPTPPHPLTRKRVLLLPFGSKGGHTHWGRGVEEPIPTKERTLWYFVYYNPSAIRLLPPPSTPYQQLVSLSQSSCVVVVATVLGSISASSDKVESEGGRWSSVEYRT